MLKKIMYKVAEEPGAGLIAILVFLIAFLVAANTCRGEEAFFDRHEVSLFTSAWVKHVNSSEDLNESNKTIGLSYDSWFGCTFENSHYNRSWFLGYTFNTKKYSIADSDFFLRGNIHTGLLYGYEDDAPNVSGWTVAAAPTAEIGFRNISAEALALPFDGGLIVVLLRYTF